MPKKSVAPLKTDSELRQLALDIVEGRVFTSWDLPTEGTMYAAIFVALDMLTRRQMLHLETHAGLIYEYRNKAASKGINGYPMFFSFQWLRKAETALVADYIRELETQRRQFLAP